MEYRAEKKSEIKFNQCVDNLWAGMTLDGFYTDGHIAVKPNDLMNKKIPATVMNKTIETSIKEMFVPENAQEYKYVCIYQIPDDKKTMDIVKLQNTQTKENLFINRKYLDNMLTYYPNAKPVGTDKNHAVLFYEDTTLVGLIMPFVIDKMAAERLEIEL